MLKPQVNHLLSHSHKTLSPPLLTRCKKCFITRNEGIDCSGSPATSTSFLSPNTLAFPLIRHSRRHTKNSVGQIKAVVGELSTNTTTSTISLRAVITVQMTVGGVLSNLMTKALDDFTDLLGKSLLLELVSAETDSKTGALKSTIKDYAHRTGQKADDLTYLAEFEVPADFGAIGAIFIENEHRKEVFVESVVIEGLPIGTVRASCNSWVHSKFDNPEKRVFFLDKETCLPSETPSGLKSLRESELAILRGEGVPEGPRKKADRIYDYDVYNDLGDPDKNIELARPVLGGSKEFPYPRRCKTGRPRTKSDPLSETRSSDVYLPRDESFSEVKNVTFQLKTVTSVLKSVLPSLETSLIDQDLGFPYFTAIDSLFNEGVNLPPLENNGFQTILPRLLKSIKDAQNNVLLFETPELIDRDKFGWVRDEEFCRQTLAGLNPLSISLVTEWPMTSKLDPEVYGPPESAITKEIVETQIRGFCTLENALKDKKLFVLDYHDIFLPYVNKVRDQKNFRTTLYGSRTLMYLTPAGTLRPLAIELVRPPGNGKPQWKRAFTPACWDATGAWLWKLAKVHALAHDSGYHQLVSHWLRTHCCTEPYILATNRQLSRMHPIYILLDPHFRYTMDINGLAREALINSGGVIESSFSPGKYSIEMSSVVYGKLWRFDREALPADLIARGMAVEDPDSPHGLKLTIEDYPYANDGLVLWDIIKEWVTSYVNHYYTEDNLIESDTELQAWWTEIRTKGHEDKKDEPWWPVLKTTKDLIGIVTTIIWVASGHHAAVNFGQYDYAGYVPNRATIARVKMPCEDPTDEEWEAFKRRPEDELLSAFPSQVQASKVMAVLDVLSTHSPEEEYIGDIMEPCFGANLQIQAAYEIFSGKLKELEGIIDGRNADVTLKNRNGVGVVPYTLLKPYSEPGVTSRGVPNSISI